MTTTSVDAYLRGLEFFSDVVHRVGPQDWQRPSPSDGWRAIDVLGHVGQTTSVGPSILRGEPAPLTWPDPPGDGVDGDPAQWWANLVAPARQAVSEADLDVIVESPMGPRSVRDGLAFPAVDLFIHAWDLACSIGIADEVEIPEDIVDSQSPFEGVGIFDNLILIIPVVNQDPYIGVKKNIALPKFPRYRRFPRPVWTKNKVHWF